MPTYDYLCGACGHAVEYFQSMSEAPKRKCPKCGKSKLVRQLGTGAGILFKGSGFYQTDYRSESYRKAESAEKSSGSCPGDAKTCAANGGPCASDAPKSSETSAPKSTPKTKKK